MKENIIGLVIYILFATTMCGMNLISKIIELIIFLKTKLTK